MTEMKYQNYPQKCSCLQKYNIHYHQSNFSCLVCTKYIFHLAIRQLRHRHSGTKKHNTRVYNLISVPQIKRLLLEDAIISNRTEPRNGGKKENQSYGEVINKKVMLKIWSLIRILYLKQQSNIIRSFYSLKFENSLYSNKFSV